MYSTNPKISMMELIMGAGVKRGGEGATKGWDKQGRVGGNKKRRAGTHNELCYILRMWEHPKPGSPADTNLTQMTQICGCTLIAAPQCQR